MRILPLTSVFTLLYSPALITADVDVSKLFHLFQGAGKCDLASMNRVATEALAMVDSALTALDEVRFFMIAPRWLVREPVAVKYYFAMFGGPTEANYNNIRHNYMRVKTWLESGEGLWRHDGGAYLACGGSFLNWVTTVQEAFPYYPGLPRGGDNIIDWLHERDPGLFLSIPSNSYLFYNRVLHRLMMFT